MEIPQSPWVPFSGLTTLAVDTFFSNTWTVSLVAVCVYCLSSYHCAYEKRLASSFPHPLIRQQQTAIGFQGNPLFVRLFPSASPSISDAPGPYSSWWPFRRLAPICQCHSYTREPKTEHNTPRLVSQCPTVGKNHFPETAGWTLANIAQ